MPMIKTTVAGQQVTHNVDLKFQTLWAIVWRMSVRAVILGSILGIAYCVYMFGFTKMTPDPLLVRWNKEQAGYAAECNTSYSQWQGMPAGHDKNVFRMFHLYRYYNHGTCSKVWGFQANQKWLDTCWAALDDMYRQKPLDEREKRLPRAVEACK